MKKGAAQPPPRLLAGLSCLLPTALVPPRVSPAGTTSHIPTAFASPASCIAPGATFLILPSHNPPPSPLHPLTALDGGSIASLPGGAFVCPSPLNPNRHLNPVPTTSLTPSLPGQVLPRKRCPSAAQPANRRTAVCM